MWEIWRFIDLCYTKRLRTYLQVLTKALMIKSDYRELGREKLVFRITSPNIV